MYELRLMQNLLRINDYVTVAEIQGDYRVPFSPFAIPCGLLKDEIFSIQTHDSIFQMKTPFVTDSLNFIKLTNHHVFLKILIFE